MLKPMRLSTGAQRQIDQSFKSRGWPRGMLAGLLETLVGHLGNDWRELARHVGGGIYECKYRCTVRDVYLFWQFEVNNRDELTILELQITDPAPPRP